MYKDEINCTASKDGGFCILIGIYRKFLCWTESVGALLILSRALLFPQFRAKENYYALVAINRRCAGSQGR